MKPDRRALLEKFASAGLAALLAPIAPLLAQDAANTSQVILLGTQGGPNYNPARTETSSLLVVGDTPYLIDCGYGTLGRIMQTQQSYLDIARIFLTHLHDDHVADLVAILGHQWTQGRVDTTTVYGPYGTDKLVEAVLMFQQANTRIRLYDEARTLNPSTVQKGMVLTATDEPVQVFQDSRISVAAISNTHYNQAALDHNPDRSLSYRFDCPDRSVVFAGDTTYSANLVKLASGADMLLCEALDFNSMKAVFNTMLARGNYKDNPDGVWNHIIGAHSTTEQVGRMAAEAKVKTLVLNHVLPGNIPPVVTDDIYIEGARKFFSGEIIVGHDLQILR